jgi:hypothetical protein
MTKKTRRAYGRNYKVDKDGKPFVDPDKVGRARRPKETWKDRFRDSSIGERQVFLDAFLTEAEKELQRSKIWIKNTRGTFEKGPCIYKVRKVKSPYQGVFRGYRIVVAWPNMAGHRPFSDEKAPSFDKPWLLVSFGDYEDADTMYAALQKVPAEMKKRGYTSANYIETSKEEQDKEAIVEAGRDTRAPRAPVPDTYEKFVGTESPEKEYERFLKGE